MAPRIVPAIATLSLGRPESGHSLPTKIRVAKAVGFDAVEISYFCLSSYATGTSRSLHDTAREIRVLLDELEMEAVSLAPLMNFEGGQDRTVHAEKLMNAKVWLQLAHILQAPLVQIPAAMISSSDSSYDLAIADLVELTDIAAAFDPPINILYEFTSWSTYVRTWQSALDVALKVDRPNFSICLDAFHIGTYLIHDNSLRIPVPPSSDRRQDLADSLKELSETPHASKFALYQLTDAAPIPDPLPPNQPVQDPDAPGLQTMSRTSRPFPYTEGGLLPVVEISRAVLEMQRSLEDGTRCWWSMETFIPRAWSEDATVPEELASMAWESWMRLKQELGV